VLVVETKSTLGQDSLRRAVLAAGIEVEPRWLDETASTNTDALALAESGAPEWTVVATGHQTAGRGRLGRSWNDVPGTSLLVSVLLRPSLLPDRAPLLTLLAAVAMVEAAGLPSMRSKWPNDLLVGDRKVGGDPDAEGILSRYLAGLKDEYEHHHFPDRVVARYAQVCSTLGRQVRATPVGGSVVEGLARDLDERGSLLVETEDGTQTVGFGEVVHLRTT
jgi:BirA family transcriptional regulator, biotin operon repressor / biotin---[acetyl-CoA-carboxylase] ligase